MCIQSIEHPGCVWDVKFLPCGDLVTGCSDGVIRIWTIDQDRMAGLPEVHAYEAQLSAYKCNTCAPFSLSKYLNVFIASFEFTIACTMKDCVCTFHILFFSCQIWSLFCWLFSKINCQINVGEKWKHIRYYIFIYWRVLFKKLYGLDVMVNADHGASLHQFHPWLTTDHGWAVTPPWIKWCSLPNLNCQHL